MERRRVLIVEDSPTMRQLLAFALRRLKDVEIVEAQDGMDGLRKVSRDHFDLAADYLRMGSHLWKRFLAKLEEEAQEEAQEEPAGA